MTAQEVVETIVAELDGREWEADTLDTIAQFLRDNGYVIRDVNDTEVD